MDIGQVVGSTIMKKVGVYILRCKNSRYYIGSTNNLERRLSEHQNGFVKSTKYLLPITLVFFQLCDNLRRARSLEYRLKSKKSSRIIDQIIREGHIKNYKTRVVSSAG